MQQLQKMKKQIRELKNELCWAHVNESKKVGHVLGILSLVREFSDVELLYLFFFSKIFKSL